MRHSPENPLTADPNRRALELFEGSPTGPSAERIEVLALSSGSKLAAISTRSRTIDLFDLEERRRLITLSDMRAW